MKILLIGGYRFLGRAIIEAASQAGHELSAFNRGVTWPAELRGVELIKGDRVEDLGEIQRRDWDVVIDTSGYHQSAVAASARALAERVRQYIFISTISVYPWPIPPGTTENAPVDILADGADADGDVDETYGQRKALCEREVSGAFPGRSLLIRPGMIVGPHDETERFTYWIARAARGDEMVAPGDPSRPLQFIDVADLADFILRLAEQSITGVVNVTGPLKGLTWGTFIDACISVTRSTGSAIWLDDYALMSHGLTPGSDFPWWLPGERNGIFEMDLTRASSYGLYCRAVRDTIERTWDWLRTLPENKRPVLLDPRREKEILAGASVNRDR